MKIALVGWDIDERVVAELASLGLESVAFTRWFPGRPIRQERAGWTLIRCPHQIGGGPRAEARSFGASVLASAGAQGVAGERDVVHALDVPSRPALEGFKGWWSGCTAIASLVEADVARDIEPGAAGAVDAWICEDPWVAACWRAEHPADARAVHVVESGRLEPREAKAPAPSTEARPPTLLILLSAEARLDPAVVVAAIARARRTAAGLRVVVRGSGIVAESLRRRLAQPGWPGEREGPDDASRPGRLREWLAGAAVVGLARASLAADPLARAAWLAGKPVVAIGGPDPRVVAEAILDALIGTERVESRVRAGAALASRRRGAAEVAASWLAVYLDGRPAAGATTAAEAAASGGSPWELGSLRSRLSLIAVDSRMAYAAWSVRPGDWSNALEWLGPDAPRASLSIRLADLTGVPFRGDNARETWDLDLSVSETHRTIRLESPGRSLAAALGVRSTRGGFHTLAHARVCHLPSEELAPAAPTRRIRVLPARDPG